MGITHFSNKTSYRSNISFLCLLFINGVFSYKYLLRYSPNSFLYTVFYMSLLAVMYLYFAHSEASWFKRQYSLVLVLLYTVACTILFLYITPGSLNVDRWSVIESFWRSVARGEYPYFTKSHMGNPPGPMPVYFILALPFYFIHEIGFFSLAGIIVCSLFWFYKKESSKEFNFIILFMLMSVMVFWEALARSTILVNAALVFIYFKWLTGLNALENKKLYYAAIFGGLLLSTRTVFVLVFILAGLVFLNSKTLKFNSLFKWTICVVIVFVATFAPFIIFYPKTFFALNPFTVQSSFLIPPYYIIIFIAISVALGFVAKKPSDIIYFSGLILFSIISVYFVYHVAKSGINAAYHGSIIDVSYYLFSVPFLLDTIHFNRSVNL